MVGGWLDWVILWVFPNFSLDPIPISIRLPREAVDAPFIPGGVQGRVGCGPGQPCFCASMRILARFCLVTSVEHFSLPWGSVRLSV